MLDCTLENTLDFKKIQRIARKMDVDILVGFPSGRMHVDATHEKKLRKDGTARQDQWGNDKREGGNTITQETSELAKELYFGSSRTPARPFLKDGVEQNKAEIRSVMETQAKSETPNWDKVGTVAVGKINEFVRGGYYKEHVPNSPATIERKGSDTPLIDGADLINSLTYIVAKGGQ